jgi:SPP1 family predicted phage head-tail adaptor
MRAGKLDRNLIIQSFTSTVDEYGTPTEAWTEFATCKAQLVQGSTDEWIAAYGESQAVTAVFRIRWLDGLTTDHRIRYFDRNLNIREISEIGRRRGLELRCEEIRA